MSRSVCRPAPLLVSTCGGSVRSVSFAPREPQSKPQFLRSRSLRHLRHVAAFFGREAIRSIGTFASASRRGLRRSSLRAHTSLTRASENGTRDLLGLLFSGLSSASVIYVNLSIITCLIEKPLDCSVLYRRRCAIGPTGRSQMRMFTGILGLSVRLDPYATRPCHNGGECSIGPARNSDVQCACASGFWFLTNSAFNLLPDTVYYLFLLSGIIYYGLMN